MKYETKMKIGLAAGLVSALFGTYVIVRDGLESHELYLKEQSITQQLEPKLRHIKLLDSTFEEKCRDSVYYGYPGTKPIAVGMELYDEARKLTGEVNEALEIRDSYREQQKRTRGTETVPAGMTLLLGGLLAYISSQRKKENPVLKEE